MDGGGSSQGGKITCDEYESQYGECQMQSGGSCADYCRAQGSDKCYVDLDEGVIDCGEGGSSSGDYMTCDEVVTDATGATVSGESSNPSLNAKWLSCVSSSLPFKIGNVYMASNSVTASTPS